MTITRFAVGDCALVRLPYAEITVPADAVGLDASRVGSESWADPVWTDGDQVRVAAAVWIIESGGTTIVVDPTSTADDILRGDDAGFHQDAVAQLLLDAGYPRESVDVAICTHVDGFGMLAWKGADGWEPFFPNAPVLINAREASAILDDGPYEPSGTDAFRALHAAGVVTTVGDDHPVTDEVALRFTGKHSPGHQVVDVSSGDECATFLGHLALNPIHCLIPEGRLHEDVPASYAELSTMSDGRLLFAPLWPTPGAAHWTDGTIEPARPE